MVFPQRPETPSDAAPRSFHLGMGWFPDEPGGLNRYLRGLLEALNADGPEASAIVSGLAADAPTYVEKVSPPAERRPLGKVLGYRRAAKRLLDSDVIDGHFAPSTLATIAVDGRRPLPLVVHFHGPWHLEGRALGDGVFRSVAKRAVERLTYRRAREAVVLSRAFGRLLVERYGVSPWRVNVIPPGVDLERFCPGDRGEARRALGLPADAWIALTVRRLVPRMGVDVLLQAWGRSSPEQGLLLVAGDGPMRPRLESDAPPGVRFLGHVDEALLPSYYRAANVSVVPSRSLEGFGLAALESLACGTPVVVTAVGGLPEAVGGLPDDIVVPSEDPAVLSDRLCAAASGAKPLPSEVEARVHAEQFTWDRAADRHRAVYRRAVTGERRRPLRVVYLDHTAVLSGAEIALLRLLPALEEVDAHVVLATDGPLVEKLEYAGVSVEVLPLSEKVRHISRRQVSEGLPLEQTALAAAHALRLAVRLRRLNPDLVHTNSLKAALYGGVAGRLAGVPVVWHVHDRIARDYLGEGADRLVRAAARSLPTAIVANSRSTLASLGVGGDVIPNPVLVSKVTSRRGEHPFTVGIVGRIARWKGQDVFIEGFARAFPDGQERALVIGAPLFGDDDRRYEAELRALVSQLGLGDRVSFTGFVDDVPASLRQLDVLVHASTLPEPFGQVVVEGMAAGVPVVAPRAGGPAEIVEDDSTGLLFTPGDSAALAARLRRLAADPSLREELSSRARVSIERYAPDAIAAQLTEVYRRTLHARKEGA